jgi:MFS superfamily sulfate permease-like transporter
MNVNPKLTYISRLERIYHLHKILEDPFNYPFSKEFCLSTLHKSPLDLVVGANSATAAIIECGLVAIAIPYSPKYVKYAGMIALLAATLLLLRDLLQLGFFADFPSHKI